MKYGDGGIHVLSATATGGGRGRSLGVAVPAFSYVHVERPPIGQSGSQRHGWFNGNHSGARWRSWAERQLRRGGALRFREKA